MKRLTPLSLILVLSTAASAGAQEPMVVTNPFEAAGPAPGSSRCRPAPGSPPTVCWP